MIDLLAGMLQDGGPWAVVAAGLAIGLIHALEPDHLGAVSTQLLAGARRPGGDDRESSSRGRPGWMRRLAGGASLRGALWGAGHASSAMLIGLLVAGLSLGIADGFFEGAEVAAGIMLIGLGVLTVAGRRRQAGGHTHPHHHEDGVVHTHGHEHGRDHTHGHRPYLIGCVHGVAGGGAVMALAASAMDGLGSAVLFLALFGIGSTAGMALASGAVGISLAMLPGAASVARYVRYAVAAVAVAVGIGMVLAVTLDGGRIFLA